MKSEQYLHILRNVTYLKKLSKKKKNLSKAEGHIKRAILDCYKYICMAYEDRYLEFENNYKRTDLSLVDNGEFLPKLLSMRKNAIDLLLEARKTDLALSSDNEESLDEAYTKYDTAFIECSAVYELINDSYKKLENLRKKAILRDFISVSGYVVGITGIILSIVFYFFPFQ